MIYFKGRDSAGMISALRSDDIRRDASDEKTSSKFLKGVRGKMIYFKVSFEI